MNINDIEIFILTYNRADFLKETLISINNQTVSGFKVIVLDNGSTDNTKKVVESFKDNNVYYVRNEVNLGVYQNMANAQKYCEKKWTLLFHDDDLMHPDYIKNVIKVISLHKELVLIGSMYKSFTDQNEVVYDKATDDFIYCKDVSSFASQMYNNISFAFCSAVYRTDIFKKIKIRDDEFGKILDTPMLLDTAKSGESLIFKYPFVNYRLHLGRDSIDSKSGPFVSEVLNLNREYLKYTGDSIFTKSGRMFLLKNFPYILEGYSWIGKDFKKGVFSFIFNGLKNGAITVPSLILGLILLIPRFVKNRLFKYWALK